MPININPKKGKRIVLKEGDVFESNVDGRFHYFQFIYNDKTYLSADLVRLFKYTSEVPLVPFDFRTLLDSGVRDPYYTMIHYGTREGAWIRVTNQTIEADFEPPTFRVTSQYKAEIANDWRLLKGGEWTPVGLLDDEMRKLPIASLKQPHQFMEIMKLGYNPFLKDVR
jgi:hypothetical protein